MKRAIAHLKSISPICFGRYYSVPKLVGETDVDFEVRTWRNRCHTTSDGRVRIPGSMIQTAVLNAAKSYVKDTIPGQGKAKYGKKFDAGVRVIDDIVLPIKVDDVDCETAFVPSSGERGGGKRVMKYFPKVNSWEGAATFEIYDDIIDEAIFEKALTAAGMYVGLGVFRPANRGNMGLFEVQKIQWEINPQMEWFKIPVREYLDRK